MQLSSSERYSKNWRLNTKYPPLTNEAWSSGFSRKETTSSPEIPRSPYLEGGNTPETVPICDDVLDAAAACWTALRILNGEADFIPKIPEFDSQGIQMAIHF